MAVSKTTKVWLTALGGGAVAVVGGVLLVTGVGSGAGAVLITTGLAAIGSVVGGGMLAGIGVLAAGTATVSSISAAIAHKVIKDPELLALAEKLRQANELYAAVSSGSKSQKAEIEELNLKIGDLLRAKKKDRAQIEELKARLIVFIRNMKMAA